MGATVHQLDGGLQAERPVAGNHDALARRDAVGARQGLQATDRHHPRQGPARDRQRLLVGAGCQHQAFGAEQGRMAGDDGGDFVGREGRPYRGLVQNPDAGQQRRLTQDRALAELPVEGRKIGRVRGRERLEILAAGLQALVGHDHVGTGQSEAARRRQAGRAGTHHQHIAGDLLGGCWGRGLARRHDGRRADIHAGFDLGEAGALAGTAIDRDQAVEADAHAAKRPSRRARTGLADGDDVGGRKRRADGLARQRLDLATVEAEANRRTRGPNIGMVQAHGKRFTMPMRIRTPTTTSSFETALRASSG